MVLNFNAKSVNSRVAKCLRLVADHLEGQGFHVRMIPLPNERGLKALSKGGGKLYTVNRLRKEAGLHEINEDRNIKLADAKWTGLCDGTAVFFQIVYWNSIAYPEFISPELIESVAKVAHEQGKNIEVLHNEKNSVIYLYEPCELPA